MEPSDGELVSAVLQGDAARFELLIQRYQARVFAMARRYARSESEVEDVVQDVFIKAFHKLASYRGEAPFEHWLMRLGVRTCYDSLRSHKRSKETAFSDVNPQSSEWLDRFVAEPSSDLESAAAARQLIEHVFSQLAPSSRLVLTLLEIEEKSVKEIAQLTGWSVPAVKVRAFRARAEMRRCLQRVAREKYL